ncbi:hypothetical protein EME01_56380 [Sinorhizobium meliloti]|nr:hypothetical protein EME01_56380 [Sinorhizobium meliloti]
MLRPCDARSETPDEMCAAIIRVYDRGIARSQESDERRKCAHDINDCGAIARSRSRQAVQNRSGDKVDALAAKQIRDRSIGIVQDD